MRDHETAQRSLYNGKDGSSRPFLTLNSRFVKFIENIFREIIQSIWQFEQMSLNFHLLSLNPSTIFTWDFKTLHLINIKCRYQDIMLKEKKLNEMWSQEPLQVNKNFNQKSIWKFMKYKHILKSLSDNWE